MAIGSYWLGGAYEVFVEEGLMDQEHLVTLVHHKLQAPLYNPNIYPITPI